MEEKKTLLFIFNPFSGKAQIKNQLMDYYKDEMVQQIASDSTEQNSLGLAQMLYEQMKRNYNLE